MINNSLYLFAGGDIGRLMPTGDAPVKGGAVGPGQKLLPASRCQVGEDQGKDTINDGCALFPYFFSGAGRPCL